MTYTEYRTLSKQNLIDSMKAQMDMSLTEAARRNANAEVKALMLGIDKKVWEIFDFCYDEE